MIIESEKKRGKDFQDPWKLNVTHGSLDRHPRLPIV